MAQGEFPSFYRYVGPSPSGGYYYDDPSTGQILDLAAAPTPEQQQAYEATNPKTGTIEQTQATTELAEPTQILGGPAQAGAQEDAPVQTPKAPTSSGVGAGTSSDPYGARGNDDTPPRSSTSNQQVINQTFANQPITPQPNVLDQYASYTYAISWWLLTPDQYNNLTTGLAPAPGTGNWSLLMQSGGAPTGGRNQYFPYDYYLDDLEIETVLMGKGTNMSNNATEIRFKVVEPNGLTLIQNLYSALQTAYKNPTAGSGAQATTTANTTANQTSQAPNYGAAQYCLTIEFYGYDSQGNLVAPARGGVSGSTSQAVIKKYYPFLIENLTFRTVANQIEYNIVGKPVPYSTGTSQARGTIPFAFQFSGQTVAQILQGSAAGAPAVQQESGARTESPSPAQIFTPTNPGATVNDIRASAGVDALGNFTGETESPFSIVAP
jgi:hypothetical protein